MAGRKPKPTALKKLEGNPGKRKLNTKERNPGNGIRMFGTEPGLYEELAVRCFHIYIMIEKL